MSNPINTVVITTDEYKKYLSLVEQLNRIKEGEKVFYFRTMYSFSNTITQWEVYNADEALKTLTFQRDDWQRTAESYDKLRLEALKKVYELEKKVKPSLFKRLFNATK